MSYLEIYEVGTLGMDCCHIGKLYSKSLYISPAVSNFYGTGIEIWAGFGPVGNTEKNLGRL